MMQDRTVKITIEEETPDDFRTLFRISLGPKIVGEHLTAVQAHLLVGEIFERIALPLQIKPNTQRDAVGSLGR
jgi:hypothetical protein